MSSENEFSVIARIGIVFTKWICSAANSPCGFGYVFFGIWTSIRITS